MDRPFGPGLLTNCAPSEMKSEAVLLVEVKTLDESANYEPYEATIAFWEARGFLKIDVIDPLPGWQPGNPCAIYVTVLLA